MCRSCSRWNSSLLRKLLRRVIPCRTHQNRTPPRSGAELRTRQLVRLMTGAEFGVNKRRIFRSDLEVLPFPGSDLEKAAASELFGHAEALRDGGGSQGEADLRRIDDLVFDWYDLDSAERIIVRDGLASARAQFKSGRSHLYAPASKEQIQEYAYTLSNVVNGWLRGRETLNSELIDVRGNEMRIVRFYANHIGQPAQGSALKLGGEFDEVLVSLSARLKVNLGPHVHTRRVLRVYGQNDFFVIKPAVTRYWMSSSALNDGDAVIAENFGRSFRAVG
jgi:hypothetical protein